MLVDDYSGLVMRFATGIRWRPEHSIVESGFSCHHCRAGHATVVLFPFTPRIEPAYHDRPASTPLPLGSAKTPSSRGMTCCDVDESSEKPTMNYAEKMANSFGSSQRPLAGMRSPASLQ